jgi:hypothetical protein
VRVDTTRGRPVRSADVNAGELIRDSGTAPGQGGGIELPRITRRHLQLAAGTLVAAWVVLVIGRAIADTAAVNDRAAQLRAENAELAGRVEAIRREAQLVQGEAYLRLEARAYGIGRGGERAFSLDPGAPPPPRIRLLGADPADDVARPPLEDWVELLFGG